MRSGLAAPPYFAGDRGEAAPILTLDLKVGEFAKSLFLRREVYEKAAFAILHDLEALPAAFNLYHLSLKFFGGCSQLLINIRD